MCGICGVVGNTELESTHSVVRQMMGQMHHRGSDNEGIFVDHSVSLRIRRLSIIDLDRGRQPVFNEDESVVVVFNGEIYNFCELRRTLESRGQIFRTGSDTEVIVHAYEEGAEDGVDYIEYVRVCPRGDLEVDSGKSESLARQGSIGHKTALLCSCRRRLAFSYRAKTKVGKA